MVILLSIIFNLGFAVFTQGEVDTNWPFVELGPAVIQDSFYMRAPGLESPYGMIGDVPGGYSLYTGNPLQTGPLDNVSGFLDSDVSWIIHYPNYGINTIVIALMFTVIPLAVIVIIGRKSYGSTKTQ
jgi:hypothetical protein